MIERIDGPGDPRVALYRGMSDAELMKSSDVFVAEGRLVVTRVIEDGRYHVQSVLLNAAGLRDLASSLDRLPPDVPVHVCETGDFLGITGHDIHRGCLALAKRPPALGFDAVAGAARTLVVLEAVTNADNVGSVFRSAAAFGIDGVLLSPTCCDPLYRKAIRTSMAATLSVPFARVEPWPAGIEAIRSAGFTIVALTPREPSDTLDAFAARQSTDVSARRLALLVGTEGAGLTAAAEAAADVRVRIPIRSGVDSLNLAVAAGIVLQRLCTP